MSSALSTGLSATTSTASIRPTVAGTPHSDIPTVIETPPSATATVSPDVYQRNLQEAREYNNIFATLAEQSACTRGQTACVAGGLGICNNGEAFEVIPCRDPGTACFALPMNTTEGHGAEFVGCFVYFGWFVDQLDCVVGGCYCVDYINRVNIVGNLRLFAIPQPLRNSQHDRPDSQSHPDQAIFLIVHFCLDIYVYLGIVFDLEVYF
ncbi:hypothetical protein N657DRAFT_680328 [Parathielavia appendiculata]|uniref:Uncharacterized protein n=1 Tax=Parathielavia appendiculata TaxID=2587402 RepID=A0AAN6U0R6_9PEZI|nr:hypothetical protein N657DRAFT_680328 [Parathielavia appendiculata]